MSIHFDNADTFEEHTYEVETVVDIFSKVSGYFTAIYYVLKYTFGYVVKYFATRKLVK